jgi:hypothetical protein
MDRVWQLEIDTFQDAQGFVFAPITEVVEPAEDATALHPEIQHQVARIRTDLDRFSPLEISSLVRHGYCVGRKTCRAHPDLFGADLPGNAPWDPLPAQRGAAAAVPAVGHQNGSAKAPAAVTAEARALQGSAFRRIWSTLPDRRDWVAYVYVPIIVPILVLLPYAAFTVYQRSHRLSQLVQSFSQGTRDLETLNDMLENKSAAWVGEHAERVRNLDVPDLKGFEILQDSRIFDLRAWQAGQAGKSAPDSLARVYRRLKVVKRGENTGNNLLRLHLLPTSPTTLVRFPPSSSSQSCGCATWEARPPARKSVALRRASTFKACPPENSSTSSWKSFPPDSTWNGDRTGPRCLFSSRRTRPS